MDFPKYPYEDYKDRHATSGAMTGYDPFYRKTGFWITILVILIVIIFIQHFPFGSYKKTMPAIPVVAANTRTADVPVYLAELGAVAPVYTITLKTQINGLLLRVLYKEGQIVKKGELLAEIDSRPYEALLTQYEGQLTRDQALLANALLDLKRYQTLWKQDSIAKQVLDTQTALVKQYEGNVRFDEGQIQTVKVNLIYCKIVSPVDGRIGLRLVDPGNFVQTSDTTGLAVIATLNPITVIFSIPEDSVPDVLEQIYAGKELSVNAYDRQQNKLLAVGKVLTIDNQIDATTGMVKLRAQFNNEKNTLFPSQFVNVGLLVKTLSQAIIVPTSAIQHGPQNNFVFLINQDKTVSVKPVKLGITYKDDTVITEGVSAGQVVVVEGADKLTDGATVSVAMAKQNNEAAPVSKKQQAVSVAQKSKARQVVKPTQPVLTAEQAIQMLHLAITKQVIHAWQIAATQHVAANLLRVDETAPIQAVKVQPKTVTAERVIKAWQMAVRNQTIRAWQIAAGEQIARAQSANTANKDSQGRTIS